MGKTGTLSTSQDKNMRARIYQPTKNAMQSGRGNEKCWILDYAPGSKRKMDPLMGWTTSADMNSQIRMKFDTKEDAIAYAKSEGLKYVVDEANTRTTKSKAYADNFKHDRIGLWTH